MIHLFKLLAFVINLSIFIICCRSEENYFSENGSDPKSNQSAYVLLATIDGNLTALDFSSGKKCWSTVLDTKGFLSSTLSKLNVMENDTQVWLIPSLDGYLFKFDQVKLQPLLSTESFVSQSALFDQFSSTAAIKLKLVYGINRHTGEIYYKCSPDACETFGKGSPENTLIVEQIIQSVSAIDSLTAEYQWHFRVVELKMRIPNVNFSRNSSFEHNTYAENSLTPFVSYKDYNNVQAVKISLMNRYVARINQSFQFAWLYKSTIPILDGWYYNGKNIQLLDPFTDEGDFFTIDSDDGTQAALLFLGTYLDQLFIKQSKKLRAKTFQNRTFIESDFYEAHFIKKSSKIKETLSLPTKESNALTLTDINMNDHGYYFYVNFSVYDNATHCIVDFKYPKFSDKFAHVNYWLQLITFTLLVLVPLLVGYWTLFYSQKKKQFANEGTSTIGPPVNVLDDSFALNSRKQDFTSRFHKDFQFITILGKGGFGVVMEVKNKIDECAYAVKRIRIRVKNEYKQLGHGPVLREVKALAKLEHPGIVRYFNSWVEYPPEGWQANKDKELDIVDVSCSTTFEEKLKSSSVDLTGSTKNVQKARQAAIFTRLKNNPVNPFNEFHEDVLNLDFSLGDCSNWSSDMSNETTSLNGNSDTLSISNESKKSISEMSLFYDHENEFEDSDEALSNTIFIYEKTTVNKNNHPSTNSARKSYVTQTSIYDIRAMFNIPDVFFIDKNAAYLHFKKINEYLLFKMSLKYLNKLYRYVFFDISCSDPDHSEWSGWSCILDDFKPSEVEMNLNLFQVWLLSVLSVLRCVESHFHNLLLANLSCILWEVSHLLQRNVCILKNCSSDNSSNIVPVKDFIVIKRKNDSLSWPMKFICLLKFRHLLFKLNDCSQSTWKSLFYNGDASNYKNDVWLFRIWILSMLSEMRLNGSGIVVTNLCRILAEVNHFIETNEEIPEQTHFFTIYGNLVPKPEEHRQRPEIFTMFRSFPLIEKTKEPNSVTELSCKSTDQDGFGFLYIQMQLCKKDSLKNWLDAHSINRNYKEVMNIFHQIVEAMSYVHAQGLMHRDLKPSNIYFSLEGHIKIGDFGLATHFKMQELHDESITLSHTNSHTSHCGTELYMSPEQSSKKRYNYKTDIFSLGVILYELLVPFTTQSERYKAIYNARDRQFSQEFKSKYSKECMLVKKLLDPEPKRRPTASEIKMHPLFNVLNLS